MLGRGLDSSDSLEVI